MRSLSRAKASASPVPIPRSAASSFAATTPAATVKSSAKVFINMTGATTPKSSLSKPPATAPAELRSTSLSSRAIIPDAPDPAPKPSSPPAFAASSPASANPPRANSTKVSPPGFAPAARSSRSNPLSPSTASLRFRLKHQRPRKTFAASGSPRKNPAPKSNACATQATLSSPASARSLPMIPCSPTAADFPAAANSFASSSIPAFASRPNPASSRPLPTISSSSPSPLSNLRKPASSRTPASNSSAPNPSAAASTCAPSCRNSAAAISSPSSLKPVPPSTPPPSPPASSTNSLSSSPPNSRVHPPSYPLLRQTAPSPRAAPFPFSRYSPPAFPPCASSPSAKSAPMSFSRPPFLADNSFFRSTHFEDGGAFDRIIFQGIQRAVRFAQRKNFGVRLYRNLGCNPQKIPPVFARVVGHAADHPLVVEQVVAKGRDRTHVDAAEDEHSAFAQRLQRRRHNLSRGSEHDRRIQRLRRRIERAACPLRPQLERQLAVTRVARRSENFRAPVPRHLDGHVRRRAESVESEPPAALDSRKPQAAKSNNSGAQQRRGLLVLKSLGNFVHKLFGRGDGFGIAAIRRVTGENRRIAKIFFLSAAIFASAIGFVQPRDAHSRANRDSSRAFAVLLHHAHHLMPRDYRRFFRWQLAFHHVQIRAARRACVDPHEQFAFRGRWLRDVREFQRIGFNSCRRSQQTRLHRRSSATFCIILPARHSARCCKL